jgi:hypothetical protein
MIWEILPLNETPDGAVTLQRLTRFGAGIAVAIDATFEVSDGLVISWKEWIHSAERLHQIASLDEAQAAQLIQRQFSEQMFAQKS